MSGAGTAGRARCACGEPATFSERPAVVARAAVIGVTDSAICDACAWRVISREAPVFAALMETAVQAEPGYEKARARAAARRAKGKP